MKKILFSLLLMVMAVPSKGALIIDDLIDELLAEEAIVYQHIKSLDWLRMEIDKERQILENANLLRIEQASYDTAFVRMNRCMGYIGVERAKINNLINKAAKIAMALTLADLIYEDIVEIVEILGDLKEVYKNATLENLPYYLDHQLTFVESKVKRVKGLINSVIANKLSIFSTREDTILKLVTDAREITNETKRSLRTFTAFICTEGFKLNNGRSLMEGIEQMATLANHTSRIFKKERQ